ncbi:uncharacterized protein AB675_10700 [Cyphellophora attinorum]|uniref:DnaJ homologue subfamily C member 28 conserved domain-containing protein n=1 Tax=Cyphellophora attinorum TaxID=1664694 RepID=A0A0N1P1G5_9EURO|nr:uncharacterized protein AB675_10700 [Phialophora attinorum]KPI40654.1 hypothetical protein AB675_10700 [Phialophora attinorum]
MAEESIDTGSPSDRRNLKAESSNFSEELKAQLEARISESAFKNENQKALSEANLPSYAGKGTRDTAAADQWLGTESLGDASLRMLDDAHKKLRFKPRAPRIATNVNLRPEPKKQVSRAARLVNARDRTSVYAMSQQEGVSEEEKEKFRKELKERFSPGARPMPVTLQGLTSLANERIEDAIARGQFRNIKRGKDVNTERDHNANSPFLDTTEYFMNKIIQKQEIVPPWIEKQQELVKQLDSFRKRLRSDWRRHAARMIASEGGPLEQQINRAKGYALAEEIVNPRISDKQKISGISSDGNLVNITVEDRIAAGIKLDEPEVKVEVTPTTTEPPTGTEAKDLHKLEQELQQEIQTIAATSATLNAVPPTVPPEVPAIAAAPAAATPPQAPPRVLPMPTPFRDPTWQRTEQAYHTLAITEINSLTRSYNLMAPKIAQRPYTNLDRELKRCFAMVAPQLADEIAERAKKGVVRGFGERVDREKGVLERVLSRKDGPVLYEKVIREEVEGKEYGWKEFWRDLWARDEKGKRKDVA